MKEKFHNIYKNKIKVLEKSYVPHNAFSLDDNIDDQLLKYLSQKNYSVSECLKLIKNKYKAKDEKSINFCKAILNFKTLINSNNNNTKEKISLSILAESLLIDPMERLKKLMNMVTITNGRYYNENNGYFNHYSQLRKKLNITINDLQTVNRYIKWFSNEINHDLLHKKSIISYFSVSESSREDNKKNKSTDFYPNFNSLIFFYFIISLSEEKENNTTCEEMKNNLLKLILNLIKEKIISEQGLITIFRKLEWIKFKEIKDTDNPYYSASYWDLKTNICNDIFGNDFFYNLSKENIGNYLKNYYIEEEKMKQDIAKQRLQNYFHNIIRMLNKDTIIELTKDYNK